MLFKIYSWTNNYFSFKDKIKRELLSSLVYNFKWNNCNAEYIGKANLHYRSRTSGHIAVSPLTGKFVKNNSQTSAVRGQLLSCKAVACPKDFSVLDKSTCNLKLEIEESTLIKLLKPPLNKNIFSVTLCICFVNDSRKICKIIP